MGAKVAFMEHPIHKGGALIARLVQQNSIEYPDLLDFMQKTSGLSAPDMEAVLQHFTNALSYYLASGNRVRTPLGIFSLSLGKTSPTIDRSGLAERRLDSNALTVKLRPDRAFVSRVALSTELETVARPPIQGPRLLRVTNLENPAPELAGSPGDLLQIHGGRLRVNPTDPETGVFLVDPATKSRAPATVYPRTGTAYLCFKIPPVPPGSYQLIVQTKPHGKHVRIGRHDALIIIG